MSEGDGPRRSARIANKRPTHQRPHLPEPKRKKSSRTPVLMDNVVSFRDALALVDKYLKSIKVSLDDPAFLFDWRLENLTPFVAAANLPNAASAPPWMRTRPPNITTWSFIDDVVSRFRTQPHPVAGGRYGDVVLAPNNIVQYGNVTSLLISLQNDDFLQSVSEAAFPGLNDPHRHLAVTYNTVDPRRERYDANALGAALRNGAPMRQLFI